MNKCSKCGAEFEGNFCPECGTPSLSPKVCPKCGAQLKENIKFCNNCGYAFLGQRDVHTADEGTRQNTSLQSSAPVKSTTPFDWRQSKVMRILLYAPMVIFVLWAVLLWAFMAAPVMKGEPPVMPNVSVYGFFNAETVEGDPDLAAITPAAGALVAVSAVALLYAGYLVYLQFKGGRVARWLAHYFSVLPYVLVLVCTSVIAVKFNTYAEGMDEMKGSFVSVTVSLTVVFLLLHAASLVLCNLLSIENITREEFAEWRAFLPYRHAYCKQRRPHVNQCLKKEPFIHGRCCGAMCILAVIFLAVMWLLLGINAIIFSSVPFVLGIVACVLAFRRKWRASAVLGWIFVIGCCAITIYFNLDTPMPATVNFLFRGDETTAQQIALFGMLPATLLFSLVNVFIQAYDECKARKRYNREYDEQMAAQGDKTALRMLNNQWTSLQQDTEVSAND